MSRTEKVPEWKVLSNLCCVLKTKMSRLCCVRANEIAELANKNQIFNFD